MNETKVFKLGTGMTLEYLSSFRVERSKVKVTGSISAFFTLMTIMPM